MERILSLFTQANNLLVGTYTLQEYEQQEALEEDINISEVVEAIKEMKRGKSTGHDRIISEMMTNLGERGNAQYLQ